MLAYPAEQYIDVNFQVDPSLIRLLQRASQHQLCNTGH